jgi:hypothetical protein
MFIPLDGPILLCKRCVNRGTKGCGVPRDKLIPKLFGTDVATPTMIIRFLNEVLPQPIAEEIAAFLTPAFYGPLK